MSTFKVSVERLEQVRPHPNADRLELAMVQGMNFQFVVAKGRCQAGDRVLYVPVDSLMPPKVAEALGLSGRLAGRERNRLKTVRLRGQISQGLVCDPGDLGLSEERARALDSAGQLTSRLGIRKYDPPPIPMQNADLVGLPDGVGVYDIEGADRFSGVLAEMMDLRVRVTEYLEGSNWSVTAASPPPHPEWMPPAIRTTSPATGTARERREPSPPLAAPSEFSVAHGRRARADTKGQKHLRSA